MGDAIAAHNSGFFKKSPEVAGTGEPSPEEWADQAARKIIAASANYHDAVEEDREANNQAMLDMLALGDDEQIAEKLLG